MKAKRKKKPKKVKKNPVSLGAVIRENLPYPIVYYPRHYGTFFAFRKDEASQAALCLCAKPAVENFIRLKEENASPRNVNPLRMAILDSGTFPKTIASISLQSKRSPIEDLNFVEGLCHRCNLVAPSLRYCHEMYGGEFIQHFGWYFNQTYLRLGIHPKQFVYLKDVCLPEYQNDIDSFKKAQGEYREEYERLSNIVSGPKRDDIAPDEVTYWRNVKIGEETKMLNLRKISSQKKRAFTTKIENITRQEFGFRKVGEGWVSETILYQIVTRIFAEQDILRHHQPDWLEGLELDMFIPSLNLALEYQGQQHFYPIQLWGGSKGLQALQERDKRKAKLCASYGIDLITVDYTEPLTEDYICEILNDAGYFTIDNLS